MNVLSAARFDSIHKTAVSRKATSPGAIESQTPGAVGDGFYSSATSETLVSRDFQARMRDAAGEIKVRKLAPETARQQQADLALEISGQAITGFEGAALTLAMRGDKGKAELVTENGIRWQLPVEPASQNASLGHVVSLPDGSKLRVQPEAPWNFGTTLERQNSEGASLSAHFKPHDVDGAYLLDSLVASTDNQNKHIGLHDKGDGVLALNVQSNEYKPGQLGLPKIEMRTAGEAGIGAIIGGQLGTMMGMGYISDSAWEPQSETATKLLNAAHRVERENPFLNPAQ